MHFVLLWLFVTKVEGLVQKTLANTYLPGRIYVIVSQNITVKFKPFILKLKQVSPVICLLFSGMQTTLAQLTYERLFVDYDSAREYKNLRIIPVRTKGPGDPQPELSNTISLPEALNKGLVTIEE